MVGVRDSSSPPRRGSPSDVFSQDINDIHKRRSDRNEGCTRTIAILCAILATVFLLSTIALAIVVGIKYNEDKNTSEVSSTAAPSTLQENRSSGPSLIYNPNENNPFRDDRPSLGDSWPLPSGSLYAHYRKASVASDHGLCSEIGRDVLIEGGNAVDAMIATLTCIGVVNPQSSGLGGGFLMTLYNETTGRCLTIDARESAPAAATEDMFLKLPKDSSVFGYKSIATPSELHGYWTVFEKFGSRKVSWSRLLEPSIKLANEGFPVSSNLAMVLSDKESMIQAEPTMKDLFVDSATGRVYEEGDILKRPTLGFTLQMLANESDPLALFYTGGMAQQIIGEMSNAGGLLTKEDLANYKTRIIENPLVAGLPGGLEMCGPPPPSSFAITQSIIAVMAEFYDGSPVDLNDPLVYHRLIEAEKFAYAQRTKLGDLDFVESAKTLVANMTNNDYAKWIKSMIKETGQPLEYYLGDLTTQVPDHGTSHVSIIDENGNAVSSTSTINQIFGSMRVSTELGIIWNDEMDDFSTPGQSNAFGFAPSESNFIAPGKRPMSSMSPMVIYNKNDNKVAMVAGASGGSFIISATAQAVVRSLLFNQTVKEAIDAPRIHNQYLPFITQFEHTVPKRIVDALTNDFKQNMSAVVKQKSVVQALEVQPDGFIHGNSDFRRQTATYPAGF
ncbi:unnamed protein product [Auanema sp. JU1783]|nr:unnamed protein product [Auanema sp. JU1783]